MLADEPTGNLDSQSSEDIMEVLKGLNRNEGQTVIVVTHELDVAYETDRIVSMLDGQIVGDSSVAILKAESEARGAAAT